MDKEKSKLELIGEIAQANNKNLELIDETNNLQQRIEKAVEYINKNWEHWCSNHVKYATETINILKGDDIDVKD